MAVGIYLEFKTIKCNQFIRLNLIILVEYYTHTKLQLFNYIF